MIRFHSTKALVALVVSCFVAGCGLPTIHYYRVNLNPVSSEADSANARVVKVERLKVQGVLDQDRIVYHNSPYEVAYYNYHRWAAPLDLMITEAVQTYLATAGGGVQVANSNSADDRKEALTLEGEVISFEEVDEGTDWYATVAMAVTLRDTSGTPLWSQRLEAKRKAEARNPTMLVQALSQALTDCLDKMLEGMKPYLK